MSRTPRCRHYRQPSDPHSASGRAAAPSVSHWLAACARHEPLSPRAVLQLSRSIQAWRNHPAGPDGAPRRLRREALRARNQLATHNLRLVSHTWKRHRSGLPLHQEATADALQEAALQLLRAAEKFDPTRGYSFSTYASFWVRHGFSLHQRTQRRLIRLPSHRIELLLRLHRLVARHQAATGEAPTLAWLAEHCGFRGRPLSVDELRSLLQQWQQTCPMELDRPLPERDKDEGPRTHLELLADRRGGADPTVSAAAALEVAGCAALTDFPDAAAQLADCAGDGLDEQRSMLPQLLRSLDPRERLLLWHRYLREHPLNARQIERVMGLSPEQQAVMEQAALQKLREGAKRAGLRVSP